MVLRRRQMEDKTKIGLAVAGGAAILGLILILRKPAGAEPPPSNGGNGLPPGTECLVDSDCPDDFVCVDGQCIPR